MSAREEYYNFLKSKKLIDIMDSLYGLSYSQKLKIINDVMFDRDNNQIYSSSEINLVLTYYYNNYILLNRSNISKLSNVLKGYCKIVRQKGKIK
jgi:hypothetical protein